MEYYNLDKQYLKRFLDEKVLLYENQSFISSDPIQIPHQFDVKEDIEIAAFLSATIAWGNRKSIISSGTKMMNAMNNSPFEFISNYSSSDFRYIADVKHRTFSELDFQNFILSLQHIYNKHGGLEVILTNGTHEGGRLDRQLSNLKSIFFEIHPDDCRSKKHLSDPEKGSACKRLHLFLRWMVRSAVNGVDFGLWRNIPLSALSCPLDVHSARVAFELGLIKRVNNDLRTLLELDSVLRSFDPKDPVRYDFALFGLGAFENFGKNMIK